MDCFKNRKSDSDLMAVPDFLECESGCTFAYAVDKGPTSLSVF